MLRQLLAFLLLGPTAGPLVAQQVPLSQPLDSGTIVRLRWRDGSQQIGRLAAPLTSISDTVLYCRYPGAPCAPGSSPRLEARPTPELVSVEVRRGDRSGRGALLGAGAGIAILGLGRWAFVNADSPAPVTGQRVTASIAFVALGAGIGALIGRGSARWLPAP